MGTIMPLPSELQTIEGAQGLFDWFGYWPVFHDSEVISLRLNRASPSSLVIHTWEMTKEIDEQNFYVLAKHVVVEFVLDEVSELDLSGFSHQNVLSSVVIEKTDTGFRLDLGPCYGLAGTIEAKTVSIRLTPGKPTDRDW
jgi:hypothetical protein